MALPTPYFCCAAIWLWLVFCALPLSAHADDTVNRTAWNSANPEVQQLIQLTRHERDTYHSQGTIIAELGDTKLEHLVEDLVGVVEARGLTGFDCEDLEQLAVQITNGDPYTERRAEQLWRADRQISLWLRQLVDEYAARQKIVRRWRQTLRSNGELEDETATQVLDLIPEQQTRCRRALASAASDFGIWLGRYVSNQQSLGYDPYDPRYLHADLQAIESDAIREQIANQWYRAPQESVGERVVRYPLRLVGRTMGYTIGDTLRSFTHLLRAPFAVSDPAQVRSHLVESPLNVFDFTNRSISNVGASVKELRNAFGRQSKRMQICRQDLGTYEGYSLLGTFFDSGRHVQLFIDQDGTEEGYHDCVPAIILTDEPESVVVERLIYIEENRKFFSEFNYSTWWRNCGEEVKGSLHLAGAAGPDFSNMGIGAEFGESFLCGGYTFAPERGEEIERLTRDIERHILFVRKLITDIEAGEGMAFPTYAYFRSNSSKNLWNVGADVRLQALISLLRSNDAVTDALVRAQTLHALTSPITLLFDENADGSWSAKPHLQEHIAQMVQELTDEDIAWLRDYFPAVADVATELI